MRPAADIETESSLDALDRARPLSRLGYAVVVLLCVMTWALSHSYRGIVHDAALYMLQALGRLNPASLGQDVFLRFGSQDRFTIFSPLYAAAIHLLGPDIAAAALTWALQCALFACAWALARTVMPASLALLGMAVLVAIPGNYGAERVFTCVEQFLTPRMAAEALALASVAVALRGRQVSALALVFLAALFHPIMAAAGIAALLCLYLVIPYPRRSLAVLAGAMGMLAAAAYALPAGHWGRFDDAWLLLVMNRSPYLFLSDWQLEDWGRTAVVLSTLTVGAAWLPGARGRSLCQAVLLTILGGLALTLLACDLLHLVLFTQLQPWRWLWMGVVVAALLLPQILRACWQADVAGRTTAILLGASWIFAAGAFALAAALAAAASLAFMRRLKPSEARLVLWGAWGMLTIALIWRVASNLQITDAHYLDLHLPLWLRRATSFAHDGSAPVAIIALAWWLARAARGRTGLIALATVSVMGCALLLPRAWAAWTAREFPPPLVAQFRPWRDRIPRGAEVFWPESPVATWLLLGSPNYLSVIQTSGMVFSREGALEFRRRALALSAAIGPQAFLDWDAGGSGMKLSRQQLQQVCQTGEFEFLVTGADLGLAPLAVLPRESAPLRNSLRLYHCGPVPP